MGENEKFEQIGKLAEEYSHVRGNLNHIVERLARAQSSSQMLANAQVFGSLRAENGRLVYNPPYQIPQQNLEGLLNYKELLEVVEEKQRLTRELDGLKQRLQALAPHLL